MHTVAEWSAVVVGQRVQVYETDYFTGRQQRVLVTYLRVAAFSTLLAHMQLQP